MTDRPPYDEADLKRVRIFLAEYNTQFLIEPGDALELKDLTWDSEALISARWVMKSMFSYRRIDGQAFRVVPALINDLHPNAFAVHLGDGLHLCVLHLGLLFAMWEMADIAASPTHIGSRQNYNRKEQHGSKSRSKYGFSIIDEVLPTLPLNPNTVVLDPYFARFRPRAKGRRLFGRVLGQHMVRFAWFHELGHGIHGHCGYLSWLTKQAAALHEMAPQAGLSLARKSVLDTLIDAQRAHEAWEFQADLNAVDVLLQCVHRNIEPLLYIKRTSMEARLVVSILAALLTAFLFDQYRKHTDIKDNGTHPDPETRLANIIDYIINYPKLDAVLLRECVIASMVELDKLRKSFPDLPDLRMMVDELTTAGSKFRVRLQQKTDDITSLQAVLERFEYTTRFDFHE